MHKRLGQILYEIGAIDALKLKELLNRQGQENMRLGQLAVKLEFASEADIILALEIQIGELLYDRGVITREQCDEVIADFKKTGARIGMLFIDKEYASEEEVMDAYRYQTVSDYA